MEKTLLGACRRQGSIEATRSAAHYRTIICTDDTQIWTKYEVLSLMKKEFKHWLTGNKHESGRTGAGARGEGVDQVGLPPRAAPPVVADDRHNRDGNGANADEQRVRSTDRPQQPDELEPVPVHGSENNQERRETRRWKGSQLFASAPRHRG